MLKKMKVYLDTSIINFLIVEDSPDYRKDTEIFFETVIAANKIEPYISRVVFEEINNTVEIERREKLLSVLEKYPHIKTRTCKKKSVNGYTTGRSKYGVYERSIRRNSVANRVGADYHGPDDFYGPEGIMKQLTSD
jgi:hypothetical protein